MVSMARRSRSGVTAVMGGTPVGATAWWEGRSDGHCRPVAWTRYPRVHADPAAPQPPPPDRRAAPGPRSSCSATSWSMSSCRPDAAAGARIGRARPGVARPGRVGGEDRPLARATRARGRRSSRPSGGTRPVVRSSTPCETTASTPRVVRVAGARTGRIGVLVTPDGERSFVADRGAALQLAPVDLEAGLVRSSRRRFTCRSTRCSASRSDSPAGAPSTLAPSGPCRDQRRSRVDRPAARAGAVGPPGRLSRRSPRTSCSRPPPRPRRCSASTRSTVCSTSRPSPSSSAASKGATVLAREGDRTTPLRSRHEHRSATDTTGAGDAFDAGFLVGWFAARAAGRSLQASLQRAALAGHRAAGRQLTMARLELPLG